MDLATNYLVLHLRSPIVPSACPLTENLDNVKRLEDAGAAAIVFHSLFEEQLHHGRHDFFSGFHQGTESFAESLPNFPYPEDFAVDPEHYLEHLRRAKVSVRVPIIASLNGHTEGGWIEFAKQIQQTGVDGLELNIYSVPCDPNENSVEIETKYLRIVAAPGHFLPEQAGTRPLRLARVAPVRVCQPTPGLYESAELFGSKRV
jgi:dihydroorotate dehydrogenase (fumarate)